MDEILTLTNFTIFLISVIMRKVLKEASIVKNRYIPLLITVIGAILGFLVYKTIDGMLTGIISAGLSIYGNELYKKTIRGEE